MRWFSVMKRERWTEEVVFFEKEEYFSNLQRSISLARHSIELETYIFELDRIGKALIQALREASARGVRVRVAVDGFGSFFWLNGLRGGIEGTKIELKVYHPLILFGRALAQLNRRLHRKVCLIDHETAFVGSFNITDRPNRDTGVRLAGPPIRILWEAFEFLWKKRFPFSRRRGQTLGLVRLNETQRMRRHSNHDLTRRIREARHRIWITNAYFVPPFFLLRSLCMAALRGVEVLLLLPEKSDHLYMKWLSQAYYQTLLLSGIRIFEFRGQFLHSKTILIDETSCMVGSTNLNHRSMIHDLEVDVLLQFETSRRIMENRFKQDLHHSNEVKLEDLSRSNVGVRLIRWVLHFFRFWA